MDHNDLTKLAEEFDTHDQSASIARAEPVQPSGDSPMIVTSLRLPEPVMHEVRRRAQERGMKATQLMREWIEEKTAHDMSLGEATIPASALLALVAEHSGHQPA